jgi:signal transduction histidine kinase
MSEPVNILLVDDNPRNLDALAAVLDPSGYRLIRAHSAQEALLALLDGDFAAIVLDIEMPGLNGIELAALIKHRKRTRDIPIMFLTAYRVDDADVVKGYAAGAADYLSKPIHPEVLRFKIAVFADLFRKSRALASVNEALSREVSERVHAQNALREANEQLEQRVEERTLELVRAVDNARAARAEAERQGRLKENFLTVVSHELRTPLNAIYGWCKLLGRPDVDHDMLRRGLDVIERNALGQTRLIEDLLDVSGIDSGRTRLQLQHVDLATVVASAAQAIGPVAQAAGVALDVATGADAPEPDERMVSGDPSRLHQVVGNLLQNAVKFTPRGGRVAVRLRRSGDHARIEVEDTGEGIDASFIPHLFEKFQQADASTRRRHGGLGLGLSIVRQLVQLHGGTVAAHSRGLGHGATFTVSLPVARVAAAGPAAAQAGGGEPADVGIAGPSPALGGLEVLLVDDQPDALEVARLLLQQHEARVTTAGSADEALALLAQRPFDVLVADIGMPGKDGYALINELRARESADRRLPAIALTAFARPDDRHRALLEGFDEHAVKPVGLRTLGDLVLRVVGPHARATVADVAPAATPTEPARVPSR